MTNSSAPDAASRRRARTPSAFSRYLPRLPWLLAAVAVVTTVGVLTGAADRSRPPVELELQTLSPSTFRLEIEQEGVVEPFRADQVHSECYWTTEILSIVPEGTWVQQGDVVCVLNSSEIEEYARQREVILIKYRARLDNALHEQALLKPQNERRLETAEFQLQTAESDLDEYANGTYPQQIEQMEKNLNMYAEQARVAQDELHHLESMRAMGMASRREMEQASLDLLERQQKYDELEAKYHLLNQFTDPRSRMRLEFRASDAKRDVIRTQIRNSLAETKAQLTTLSYERTLQIYERYYKRAKDSIEACTIRAPRAGQVVYGNSWYEKSRGINQIEEGKRVRYRQKLFEIPDESRLKVSVPVPESLITRIQQGAPAVVRLKGYEKDEIAGEIAAVSRYPRVRSRYTPSVKDYWLDIALQPNEAQVKLLRPRMDATVQLTLTELKDVVSVPRDAIVGCVGENFVWVYDGNELQPRKIQLGESNETVVCVADGLAAGEQVAVALTDHHRQLLTERLTEELQPLEEVQ